jgi:hypothetical protein
MAKRKSWVVTRTKEKLPLDLVDTDEKGKEIHPEWIEVWSELTAGEAKRIETAGLSRMQPSEGSAYGDADMKLDVLIRWQDAEVERVLTWCTDWSLVDPKGKLMDLNKENLLSISPEAFQSIIRALDKHVEFKEEEKKASSGGTNGGSDAKKISSA